MRVGRIPDFINGFQSRVNGCIKANSMVGAEQVVVDRTGCANGRNTKFVEKQGGTRKRPISTDGDQAFDAKLL